MLNYHVIAVTAFQQNCTIFWDPNTLKAGIVDPGGDVEKITSFVKEKKLILEKILCTHGHLDHVGAVFDIAQIYNIPIIGPHEEDRFWIEAMPELAKDYQFPESKVFESDKWLVQGDKIEVAGKIFEVLHCPGHTPGHVVFFQREDKMALVGDVLFQGSIGRTDFPKGNHQDLIDSITQKLWPLGNDITFISGHGDKSTFGQERQSNPFVSDMVLG